MNDRHAYLIEAHNNYRILKFLIEALDDERNDIYIHMDKKSKDFDKNMICSEVSKSKVYFTESLNVRWGGYSQIKVELDLLEMAIKNNYARYHLISGVDFPIKSQDYIHSYFAENKEKEYVHFDYSITPNLFEGRMQQYHLLRDLIDRKNVVLNKLELVLVHLQILLHINRKLPKDYKMQKGANWFSITHDLADYVVENEKWIRKYFKFTKCCDEVFLQTIVYNSRFQENLFYDEYEKRNSNLRYVDWKRGNPYIFRSSDYEQLLSSHYLFARKFDEGVDIEIVEKLYNTFTKSEDERMFT